MILLVASGRGGGDGPPVFFTVPWSPHIAERGEMPGRIFSTIRDLQMNLESGTAEERAAFLTMSDSGLLLLSLKVTGYDLAAAIGITVARRMMLELGMHVPPV